MRLSSHSLASRVHTRAMIFKVIRFAIGILNQRPPAEDHCGIVNICCDVATISERINFVVLEEEMGCLFSILNRTRS